MEKERKRLLKSGFGSKAKHKQLNSDQCKQGPVLKKHLDIYA